MDRVFFGEDIPESFLLGDLIEVGCVDQQAGLCAQGLAHLWVGVAETADGDAGQRVEIPPSAGVPEPSAFAMREGHREPLVGCH